MFEKRLRLEFEVTVVGVPLLSQQVVILAQVEGLKLKVPELSPFEQTPSVTKNLQPGVARQPKRQCFGEKVLNEVISLPGASDEVVRERPHFGQL